jgi:hypothetical protein
VQLVAKGNIKLRRSAKLRWLNPDKEARKKFHQRFPVGVTETHREGKEKCN